MISKGRKGVTSSWSKVPCSRSRATDIAVSIMVWISVSVPIMPGIMNQRVSRFGLYQARATSCTRRRRDAVVVTPVDVELLDDARDIAHRRAGGVGIAAVGDHLHVRALAGQQAPLELLVDLHDQQRAARVDQGLDVARALQVRDSLEHARTVEPGQQLRAKRRCGPGRAPHRGRD